MFFSTAFLVLALSSFAFSAPTPLKRQTGNAAIDKCLADLDACRTDIAVNSAAQAECSAAAFAGATAVSELCEDQVPFLGGGLDVVTGDQGDIDQCLADVNACSQNSDLNASARLACEAAVGQGAFNACDGIPVLPGGGGSAFDVVVPASQAEVAQCRADFDACRANTALNASVRLTCEGAIGQGQFDACDGIP
ncbi:hypothetical protein DL96DRAFT_11698 [Flagelloscypha sp. PMI_526]|nr:hypothetical protein DL96DRAFT_11698 [Flagelloscypha sp. PMI_526]